MVPGSTVQFGAASFTQGEAAGAATISVTRGGSLTRTTRATFAASDGSASGTVVFAPGKTAKTFTVPIADNAADNPDRAISLTLAAGDALTTAAAAATLTVTDDDAGGANPPRRTPRRRPLTLAAPRAMTLAAFRRGMKVTIRPSEPARIELALEGTITSARISAFNVTLAKVTIGRLAGTRRVTLKPSRRVAGTPRKRSVKVRVRLVATDAAGNRRTTTRTITVRCCDAWNTCRERHARRWTG